MAGWLADLVVSCYVLLCLADFFEAREAFLEGGLSHGRRTTCRSFGLHSNAGSCLRRGIAGHGAEPEYREGVL